MASSGSGHSAACGPRQFQLLPLTEPAQHQQGLAALGVELNGPFSGEGRLSTGQIGRGKEGEAFSSLQLAKPLEGPLREESVPYRGGRRAELW